MQFQTHEMHGLNANPIPSESSLNFKWNNNAPINIPWIAFGALTHETFAPPLCATCDTHISGQSSTNGL